ncbi:MAG TPA: DUF523 domain-containing protein [Caproiciproducens sp.]|nr:DUF523 domain-containing protein [Caproiciproducens sp.]
MNILVSACLLGLNCRYKGDNKYDRQVAALSKKHHLIPVCPEQMGGLPTPRPPVEILEGRALDSTGKDVTLAFRMGAEEVLKLARLYDCKIAVLKSRSPSCGCGMIHDGTFTGGMTQGNGFTARRLLEEGVQVVSEEDIDGPAGLDGREDNI